MSESSKANGTLVLSRKPDQAVILRDEDGNEIGRIVVCEVHRRKGSVELGLAFPKSIKIHREECVPQRV